MRLHGMRVVALQLQRQRQQKGAHIVPSVIRHLMQDLLTLRAASSMESIVAAASVLTRYS